MATLRLVPVSGPAIDDVKDASMVGRDPSCEIVVTDGSVSRRHARLERRAGVWWVVDQGSANGTYINSLKVGEQALKNNQELRFGAMAFRVDLREDPEATVATPFLADDSATVMASPTPPPIPPLPVPPLPPPPAAVAPPPKKGKSPLFWVAIGCCGCLLLVAALAGVIGGGVFMATKGAADAAHAWLGHVRQGHTDEVAAGMTESYRSRPTAEEVEALTHAIGESKDASFLSRSVDNDRATLTGVLTGGPSPQPIVIKLVKERGVWKVDDVTIGVP
jgi:hypothetical protein